MNQTQPWVKTYKPTNFNKVVEHNETINIIDKLIQNNSMMNLIFYGPMGVGKSSIASIISNKLYGKDSSMMTLRLNASDSRGINDIRVIIQKFAEVYYEKKRLIILDEADSMTLDAQLALRKIIDNNNKRVHFCLICNYIGKIHPAIISRCVMFYFNPINENTISLYLKNIMESENKKYSYSALNSISKICKGDLRQAIHLLYSLSFKDELTINDVYLFTGNILPCHVSEIESIIDNLYSSTDHINFYITFKHFKKLISNNGYHLYQIIDILTQYIYKNELYHLFPKLAEIETRLAFDFSENIQLASIIYLFIKT